MPTLKCRRRSSSDGKSDGYFVPMILSPALILSLLLLLLVSSVSLVSADSALPSDPHSESLSDQSSPAEVAATNIPVFESVNRRLTFHEGETARLDCLVRDLGKDSFLMSRRPTAALAVLPLSLSLSF